MFQKMRGACAAVSTGLWTALCAMLIYMPSPAQADTVERLFVGLFGPTTQEVRFRVPRDETRFLAEASQLLIDGFRLEDVEVFRAPGGIRYAGLWREGSGDNFIQGPMPITDVAAARQAQDALGNLLVDFEFMRDPGQRFTGVWRNGTGNERISGGLEVDAFVARGESFIAQGLRLVDVELDRSSGGVPLYRGLWREGTGGNFFVSRRSRAAFNAARQDLAQQGLVLVDVEVEQGENNVLYAGVFASADDVPDGRRIVTRPRRLATFANLIEAQKAAGRALLDIEILERVIPDDDDEEPGGGGGGGEPVVPEAALPLPPWIEFTDQPRVVVDFTQNTVDGFRITLPVGFLQDLPIIGGEFVIPDQMCGIRVRKPLRFDWNEDGAQLTDDVLFNHMPVDNPNTATDEELNFFTDEQYLGGIGFTAPIGPCKSDPQWFFPGPLTGTDQGFTAPARELILTIALGSDSEVIFLDDSRPKAKTIPWDKLFKDVNFVQKINKMISTFKITKDEDGTGICGVINYLTKTCEPSPGGVECGHAQDVLELANC